MSAQEYEYKAEMQQLLHLIINSLYTHPEVFLRELISNASDALNKVRFHLLTDKNILNPDAPLRISIRVDSKEQTFEIEDSGCGMTHDDLIERVGTVASSGTLEFVKTMQESGKKPEELIGQFGVGFYSVFMVADEVTIETRHMDPDSKGYRWKSDGQGKFSIEEIALKNRGTTISFKLKDDHKEFAYDHTLKSIVEKYSNFVDFDIYVDKDKVNTVSALWHKNRSEVTDEEKKEFYRFISHDFGDPLEDLHLSIEGAVNFKALLFVPEKAPMGLFREDFERSLQLYSNRVFIQDDCRDLLPEYLRYIRGVVDTEDLPLNVSREVTQSSPAMKKINNILTDKVLKLQEDLSEDEEKYTNFFREFGGILKTGLNTELKHKDRLIDLLRFESTATDAGEYTTLKAYVEGMAEEQEEIYYLISEHRELAERSPNLEYFKKNDIEVLFLLDPVDPFIVSFLNEYEEKKLKTIEQSDIDLKDDDEKKDAVAGEKAESLLSAIKKVLGESVEDVVESKRLVDSAATLVAGDSGMDAQTERMMRMMNKDFQSAAKILEINMSHPLISNLSRLHDDKNEEMVESCAQQLFEGALLLDGTLEQKSDFVSRMTEFMVQATS
ncbi:MAG: molecular chaperone HtpG [Planctomycetota bacterium]|nr:molecular chaperone HtpG [Planctomycetota bacterium]